ncbi:DNA polymerase I [Paludibacter propionicigenes WB4]|uniref:DNA polymerase I n=1 Tax=Paludibacter propionicigenes (strain DSM 17365 / JCM 13257 / WB4) TaxID=694427 RepID=E4T6I9_PALPW|nr:DNA polymerase I [Paludibacter propionicigenes]ADQ80333.1 DNA polymerase I [Paludibacter propionicigenes WB4]
MKKLFLVDAYAIIYRAYYAFIRNPRVNSKGLNTSAIFGFVNTLEDVLKREKPTHIAVAFDPKGKTFRHEAYEQYKAQREATPEDIRLAVPIIKNLIKAYNIPALEIPGYEADDVIGTMAKKAEQAGFEVFMLTPDKDYGQLVSDHIFMYRPKHTGGFETMGPDEVKAKYDLDSHEQVIDLLGLMGDASDNIPGCPGVGEKTAVKLLKEFGSIDTLLSRTGELKGALKTKIEENKEQIIFSRFLATIKVDVPIDFDEKSLEIVPRNETELRALFDELEFRTMSAKLATPFSSFPPDQPLPSIRQVKPKPAGQMSLFDEAESNDVKPTEKQSDAAPADEQQVVVSTSGMKGLENIPHKYVLIDTKVKRSNLISQLFIQKSVCFDTETTGLDMFTSDLVGMSFCFAEGEAYYVSLPEDKTESKEVLREFKAFFENDRIEKIGQNMKFDLLMLWQYGIELKGKLFDTMIAHYLVQPELRHGMDYLAEIYLNYRTIHFEDLVGAKGKNQADIRTVDINKLCDYAAEDADVTFRLKQILEKELKADALENLFYEIEMPLMQVLATMEHTGVRIDSEALRQSSVILTDEMLKLEKEIHQLAGYEFNVSSPMQVGEILFDRLKLDDKAKKTKTGQYSTSEDILEKLQSKHPIIGKILDYRGLKKLLSTYIDALPQLISPITGKVHTSYNQTVAATGRLSSTNPNLQNIPIRDAQGKEIRKAFIPDADCLFFSADYSQIELRIMAHLSGDKNMLEAFNSGHDIHTATAAKIYKIPLEEVTSDMRRKAKTANFGIIYGISVFGLSDRLSIPRAEAKELIEGYFATYPDVKKYMDNAIQKAKEMGYVETLLGRKRFLPDINSQNSIVRGFAERNAINAPIQGTAADIIKIAMVRIQNRLENESLQAKMTMQVHDELNFTVPKNELEALQKAVIEEMENAIKLQVPLIADCGVGANWLEAH